MHLGRNEIKTYPSDRLPLHERFGQINHYADAGDDALVLGEFGNEDDKDLTW